MTTLKNKFTKGQKVSYFGNPATVRNFKLNVFTNEFTYSISYTENKLRKAQTGVAEYLLK